MFTRQDYIDQLTYDNGKIKVLVGVRRSGKSALLESFRAILRRQGVENKQIQLVDFNWLKDRRLLRPNFLLAAIEKKLVKEQENYLFLDELEVINNFVPLLQRLFSYPGLHIIVTGSTSRTIQQLAPLADQCQLIRVLPLSYQEYLQWHHQSVDHQSLLAYLNNGGFPFAQNIHENESQQNYIEEVINTTMMAAFVRQGTMCKPALTSILATFLVQHVGQVLNVSQMVQEMAQSGIKVSNKTVSTYLHLLTDTFLFIPCYECNPLTGHQKSTRVRFFPIDPSIKNTLTRHHSAVSASNLVALAFLKLYRQGYQLSSGHFQDQSLTFVAQKENQARYFQFAYSLASQDQYQEVIKPLQELPASADKTLIVAKKPQWLLREDPHIRHCGFLNWLRTSD